jgi:hypothetical protein
MRRRRVDWILNLLGSGEGLIALLVAGLLVLLGIEKRGKEKAKREAKEKEEVIQNLKAREAEQAKVDKTAHEVKDKMATEERKNATEKAEEQKKVADIPEEETHELSPKVKELAKKQVARSRTGK